MITYKIVTADRPDTLTDRVNRAISNGWQVYGNPVVTQTSRKYGLGWNSDMIWAQTMVLECDEEIPEDALEEIFMSIIGD
jgi:hypothetical protein